MTSVLIFSAFHLGLAYIVSVIIDVVSTPSFDSNLAQVKAHAPPPSSLRDFQLHAPT